MSFILDALRKSEHDRRRGAAPMVTHVPYAVPRARLPLWVPLALGMLVLALGGTGFAWWQTGRIAANSSPQRAATVFDAMSLAADGPRAADARAVPPVADARAVPPVADARPVPPAASSNAAAETSLTERSTSRGQSSSDTARSDSPPGARAFAASGAYGAEPRLQLHVYSTESAARFVMIDGKRYAEGATLPSGAQVVTIDPTGVVLRDQGREFTLRP